MQTHGTHAPALHVCIDAHALVVKPRPSALHTVRVVAEPHEAVPGVQSHAPQRPVPGVQLWPEGHVVVAVYPRPVERHSRVPDVPTHSGSEGAQMRVSHAPVAGLQLCVSLHAAAVHASPSALHTSRAVRLPLTQRPTPGVQTRSRHAPPLHDCAGPHGVAV